MQTEMLIVQYIERLSEYMRQSMRDYRQTAECEELFKLTITQLHYLHAIHEIDEVTFRDLVERFNVQKPTVTDAVNRLILRGLVVKTQSTQDLRVYYLSLTDKGEALLEIERRGYYKFAQEMTVGLAEREKQQFTQLLEKMVKKLN